MGARFEGHVSLWMRESSRLKLETIRILNDFRKNILSTEFLDGDWKLRSQIDAKPLTQLSLV